MTYTFEVPDTQKKSLTNNSCEFTDNITNRIITGSKKFFDRLHTHTYKYLKKFITTTKLITKSQ